MGCCQSRKGNYSISIKTGDSPGAGTDAVVTLSLIGTQGDLKLNFPRFSMKNRFERFQTDLFEENGADVGDVLYITLTLTPNGTLFNDWQCEWVRVESRYTNREYFFPVYKILKEKRQPTVTIREAYATIATKGSLDKLAPKDQKLRGELLLKSQRDYRWNVPIIRDLGNNRCWWCQTKVDEASQIQCQDCKFAVYCSKEHLKEDGSYHVHQCPKEYIASFEGTEEVTGRILAKGSATDDWGQHLPPNELLSAEKYQSRDYERTYAKLDALLVKITGLFTDKNERGEKVYDTVYKVPEAFKKPPRGDKWKEDAEFGYLRVAGCNPFVLRRFTEIPKNFPVTDELLKPFLPEGETIESEIKAGHLYYVEYAHQDLPRFFAYDEEKDKDAKEDTRKRLSPICLLRVEGTKLLPIAIQLKLDNPDPDSNPIYLPNDGAAWLLAKICVNTEDAFRHQTHEHLLMTHFLSEAFVVSAHRTLSENHPLYKLLIPHMKNNLSINLSGILILLDKGKAFDKLTNARASGAFQLIRQLAKTLNLWDHMPENNFKLRGVDDEKALPFYPWRDDSLRIWKILKEYVKSVLGHFYKDEKIEDDVEVQNFINEIKTRGYLRIPTAFPERKEPYGMEEVVDLATLFIWSSSVRHSAANEPQYNVYGYLPYYPFGLYRFPPELLEEKIDKTKITEQTIFDCLPGRENAMLQAIISHVLASEPHGEERLGEFRARYFREKEVLDLQSKCKKDLDTLAGDINDREAKTDYPYAHLNPKALPISVTS